MQIQETSKILKCLLAQKDIRMTDLARNISIPQSTIQRIISGATKKPHPDSLYAIANYFSIDVDQLQGKRQIPWLNITGLFGTNISNFNEVPLLNWEQAATWPSDCKEITKDQYKLVLTDSKVSANAYALEIKDLSMEPIFNKGSIIIMDPEKVVKDRCYAIVKQAKQKEVIFRQVLIDGGRYYMKPLSPDLSQFEILPLGDGDECKAVLVEAKRYYGD